MYLIRMRNIITKNMRVCVCVTYYIYIWFYYIYMHIYIYICVYVNIYMYICVYIHMYVFKYIYVWLSVCVRACFSLFAYIPENPNDHFPPGLLVDYHYQGVKWVIWLSGLPCLNVPYFVSFRVTIWTLKKIAKVQFPNLFRIGFYVSIFFGGYLSIQPVSLILHNNYVRYCLIPRGYI